MSPILEKFANFLSIHEQTDCIEHVDLSSLIRDCSLITPVQLKLSDECCDRDLATCVVQNILKYAPDQKFPLLGLRALKQILSKNASIEEVRLQHILLIHLSKGIIPPENLSKMIVLKINGLTTEFNFNARVDDWLMIAHKTTEHRNVRHLINNLISETFGSHLAAKISETNDIKVDVSFFWCELALLRGFSGFNTVHINWKYFDERFHEAKQNKKLILADIATVVIHELAHVRVRQVFNDMNFNTPIMKTGNGANNVEFGRIVEKKVFRVAIDWLDSIEKMPPTFLDAFLTSIEDNKDLPTIPPGTIVFPRTEPVTFHGGTGLDISRDCVFE